MTEVIWLLLLVPFAASLGAQKLVRSTYRRYRAERAVAALRQMLPQRVHVRRDDAAAEITSESAPVEPERQFSPARTAVVRCRRA
jgi:hypothetical protein